DGLDLDARRVDAVTNGDHERRDTGPRLAVGALARGGCRYERRLRRADRVGARGLVAVKAEVVRRQAGKRAGLLRQRRERVAVAVEARGVELPELGFGRFGLPDAVGLRAERVDRLAGLLVLDDLQARDPATRAGVELTRDEHVRRDLVDGV